MDTRNKGKEVENPYEVDPESGRVDYNGFPPLSRVYCDAGVWPAGEALGNINSERNYTYRIPRARRFYQESSRPNTMSDHSSESSSRQPQNIKPILTIRNPSPRSPTPSPPESSVPGLPCGGISPFPGPELNTPQDTNFLTVQPVAFGRRSIDVHRSQFSGFLSARASDSVNHRASSCPSCHQRSKVHCALGDGAREAHEGKGKEQNSNCHEPVREPPEPSPVHNAVNAGDYNDIFGTFGQHDDFSLPNNFILRTKTNAARPRIQDIFIPTLSRQVSWADLGAVGRDTQPQTSINPDPSLYPREASLDAPSIQASGPSGEASSSKQAQVSLAPPDNATPTNKSIKRKRSMLGALGLRGGDARPNRLSWAIDAAGRESVVPLAVVDQPWISDHAHSESVTSGHYLFKVGSLKIGKGFAFNARAKSPYPRNLNTSSRTINMQPTPQDSPPQSKWSTLNLHPRRAYPYLTKARSAISLRHSRASTMAAGNSSGSPRNVASQVEINVESFRGRTRENGLPALNLAQEFGRKNDLLAMETGYRIPERMGSPTRSERIELYGEDVVDGSFVSRTKRRLSKVFPMASGAGRQLSRGI